MSSFLTRVRGYIPALQVTLAGFIGFIPLMTLPLMIGVLVDYQHYSQKVAGTVSAAQLFGVSIGILLLSRYTLRYGLKNNVSCAALFVLVIEIVSLLFEALPALYVFRFLSGLGGGVVAGCTYTWLGNSRDPDRGFGLFLLIQFLLGALLLYILPLGFSRFGAEVIKLPFLFFAVLAIVFSAAFKGTDERSDERISFREILAAKGAVPALLAVGLFELAMSLVWAQVERLGSTWQLSAAVISQALALATLAGLLGALLVVLVGVKLGRALSIIIGISIIVAVLLALITYQSSLIIFIVSMVLFNIAWSFTVPYLQGVQASLGAGAGVVCLGAFVITVSLALGPALSGFLVASYGFLGAVIGAMILLVFCLYFVCSAIFSQKKIRSQGAKNSDVITAQK
ncbi:MFS transporter [Dasania marina]|uniref:MFS transporter n=1 Tax=Dasania marina TaxID=471499 RepID=UPI0030D8D23D|tara:strand:+ start:69988 stop:71181 length:1194 start_codon:yes stop_codon:yes gene_type:complete